MIEKERVIEHVHQAFDKTAHPGDAFLYYIGQEGLSPTRKFVRYVDFTAPSFDA